MQQCIEEWWSPHYVCKEFNIIINLYRALSHIYHTQEQSINCNLSPTMYAVNVSVEAGL